MKKLQWGVAAIGMAMACGEEKPGQGLVLLLDSDLTIPGSVNEVGLYVEHVVEGRRTLILAQEAKPLFDEQTGTYRLPFTQTFAIESSLEGGNDRIRARFVAYAPDGSVVGMREARSAIPKDHVRQLRLPIRFVNEGRVQDSQRTGPVPAGNEVSPQQIAADARPDPFGRFRHAECGEDETLGDDGECAGIDVDDLEQLAEGQVLVPSTTCFDTATCFSGTEGVRELPIEAGCRVTIPERTGAELALAIPVANGYAVANGTAGTTHAQPIDAGLYELAGNVLSMKSALCKRIERDSITSVLVSAKCSARSLDAPICAAWQTVKAPSPATPGRFVGDPTDPGPGDASDGDADSSVETDDGGDGGDESDAGDAGDGTVDRFFVIEDPAVTKVGSFAANDEGMAWLLLRTSAAGHLHRSQPGTGETSAGPSIPLSQSDSTAFLELGADSSAYLLHPTQGELSTVLKPGATSPVALKFGVPCNDPPQTGSSFFTVGRFQGKTIAMYSGPGGSLATGGFVDPDDSACFPASPPPAPEITYSPTQLERGSGFGTRWLLPIVHEAYFLALDPAGAPSAPSIAPFSGGALESFIALGGGDAIVSSRTGGSPPHDGVFYRVSLTNDEPVVAATALHSHPGTWNTREIFGANGTMCARMLTGASSAGAGVECFQREGNDFVRFEIGANKSLRDVHVYGDDTYAYFSQLCYENSTPKRVHVVAKPWPEVSTGVEQLLFEGCPTPPF